MKNLIPKMIMLWIFWLIVINAYSEKTCHANQAYPIIHTFSQPDGTIFSARQWGDERSHGWETLDRFTIMQNPQGYWTYAIQDITGRLVASSLVVGKDDPASVGISLPITLMRMDRMAFANGEIPVILLTFPNMTPAMTADEFKKRWFESDRDIQMTGWYTASHSQTYYGKDVLDAQGKRVRDQHVAALICEAVNAADMSLNFANYDTNKDCYVDMLMLVHQGKAQEDTRHSDDLFSLSGTLNEARLSGDGIGEIITQDRCHSESLMKVNAYIIQPEIRLLRK